MNILFSELSSMLGAAFLLLLALLRIRQAADGQMAAALLAAQSGLAAFLLVMHRPVIRPNSMRMTLVSWACVLAPLTFQTTTTALSASLPGLLLSLWSLAALGTCFSVPPEDRGIVSRGPYRLVRHPMYLGELLSLLGLVVSSASLHNGLVLVGFLVLIVLRIRAEERVIRGYEIYAGRVHWRLLPFVW